MRITGYSKLSELLAYSWLNQEKQISGFWCHHCYIHFCISHFSFFPLFPFSLSPYSLSLISFHHSLVHFCSCWNEVIFHRFVKKHFWVEGKQLNQRNLCICYLHGKRGFADVMKDFVMGRLFWINQIGII